MTDHDTQRIALRPLIELDTEQSKPEEIFQNTTLRPILKMQHSLITQVFASYIRKRKEVYFLLNKKDQLDWVSNSIRSDLGLRYQLCGMVIGQFTMEELDYFLGHEAEATRRIINLLIQRIQSEVFEPTARA